MATYDPTDALSGLPPLSAAAGAAAYAQSGAAPQKSWAPWAALKAGTHEALGGFGGAAQALGTVWGVPGLADAGQSFAQSQQQHATEAGRSDLEGNLTTPAGIGYNVIKSLPSLGMMIGSAALTEGGSLAAGLEPAAARIAGMVGAGASAYPGAVAGNVAAATKNGQQPLTQEQAATSLGMGVPEAAVMSYMPSSLLGVLEHGAAGKIGQRLLTGAGVNAAVGGVQSGLTTAMTGLMDPDKTVAERAQDVVQSALSGGIMGGVVGGAIHAARPMKLPTATPDDTLKSTVDQALNQQQPGQPAAPTGLAAVLAEKGQTSLEGNGVNAPIEPTPEQALREALGGSPIEGGEEGVAPASPLPIDQNAELAPGAPPAPPVPEPLPTVVGPKDASGAAQIGLDLPVDRAPNAEGEASPLPGGPAPDDTQARLWTDKEMGARVPAVIDMRNSLREQFTKGLRGKQDTSFIDNLDATNTPELVKAVKDQVAVYDRDNDGKLPGWFQKLSDSLGVTKDGASFDPVQEQADLQGQAAAIRAKADKAYNDRMTGKRLQQLGADTPAGAKEASLAKDAHDAQIAKAADLETQAAALQDHVDAHTSADALPDRYAPEEVPDPVKNQGQDVVDKWQQAKLFSKSDDPVAAKAGDLAAKFIEQGRSAMADAQLGRANKAQRAKIEVKKSASPALDEHLRAAEDTTQPQDVQEQPEVDREAEARTASNPETPAETEAAVTQPGPHPVVEPKDMSPEAQMVVRDKLTPKETTPAAPVETKSDAIKRMRAQREDATKITPGMEQAAAQERADYAAQTQEQRAHQRAVENFVRLKQTEGAPVSDAVKKAANMTPEVVKTPPITKAADFAAWKAKQRDVLSRMAEPLTRTQGDVDMEGMISHGASSKEILDHLAQHGDTPFVQQVARMLRRLGLKSTISFEDHPDTLPADRAALDSQSSHGELQGTYDEKVDHVRMISRSDMQANVLHELVHAATHQAINDGNPVAAKLEAMRSQLERSMKVKGLELPYGLTNLHEFVAEAFSNKAFQKLLDDHATTKNMTLWDKFKDAITKMLGMGKRTMLDDVLEHGQSLMDAPRPGSISDTNQRAQIHAKRADAVLAKAQNYLRDEGLGKISLKYKARGQMLGWSTMTNIRDVYGKAMTGLHQLVEGRHTRDVLNARISQKSLAARAAVDVASAQRPQVRELIQKLMTYHQNAIDPRRDWAGHDWLHGDKNADELHRLVDQANKEYGTLRQLKGDAAYEGLVAANKSDELAKMASMVYEYGHYEFAGQNLPEFAQHPMERYQLDQTGVHDSPVKSEAFWRNELQSQIDATKRARGNISATQDQEEHTPSQTRAKAQLDKAKAALADLEAQRKALPRGASQEQRDQIKASKTALQKQIDTLSDTSRTPIEKGLDTLDELVNDMAGRLKDLDQAPYFHQGRYGKFFVSGHLHIKDGKVVPEHIEAFQKALDSKDFGQYALNHLGDKSTVFLKCETADQAAELQQLMMKGQKEGWLDDSKPVHAGEPSTSDVMTNVGPGYLKRIMERTAASKAFEPTDGMDKDTSDALRKARQTMISEMNAQYLDALPANSITKVYQTRKNVQGFDKDMLRNFSHRAQVAANNLSNLAAQHKIDKAMISLNSDVEAAKSSGDINKALMAQQVLKEVATRETNRAWHLDTTMVDHIRAANHAFYLGASVSYMLEQLSQLPMLLLPELGKTHGFLNSAKAIAQVTPEAFKIMKALAMSPQHRWDAVLTPDLLRGANVSEAKIKMLMGVANRGGLDMNTFTREMGQAAAGGEISGVTKALQRANSTAVYAEMLSRVISVLSADKLHVGEGDAHNAYVDHVLSQSMMDWGSWNTSRQTSKFGFAGKITPLMMSFTGYQTRLIEKLYREVHDAVGGDTPEDKAASRKFLAGHLAAVTAISGTLGMPMASALAGVASNAANFFTGKDNFDVETSYREFLADMLGKDLGQVVAKGLPTAAGVDLSDLGDQNITPFSKLLSDRRKLEESMGDWAKGAMGSPFGVGVNWLEGMRDIAYGLPMQGMAKMVPHGLKGPMDAARMAAYGYEDNHGRQLPITADAQDILLRAVGLDPADKEEYDDKARKATAFKEMRSERAQFIRERLELATAHGDQAGLNSAIQAAQSYGMDHVQQQILPHLGSIVQADKLKSATAGALGLPLGVNPQSDIETATRLGRF